tara:strand:- start:27 stop:128 length:102 start_codon:yes stop_codon:yes gene_type:complete
MDPNISLVSAVKLKFEVILRPELIIIGANTGKK